MGLCVFIGKFEMPAGSAQTHLAPALRKVSLRLRRGSRTKLANIGVAVTWEAQAWAMQSRPGESVS
jgi:hypothetical protein